MRITRVLLAGGVLGVAALAHGSSRAAPSADRLPAPVVIESGFQLSHRDQIEPNRRIRRIQIPPPTYPRNAICCIAPGVWWDMRHGYLVFGRGRRTLWHSHGDLPVGAGSFDFQAAVGSHAVAFLYDNYLYLAPDGGAQRRIGPSETPLGFTNGGLYTYRWGRRLLLRSESGEILKTIARVPPNDYYVAKGALYFISRGTVMRARGERVQRLVSLRALGLSRRTSSLQPAGSLLELEDRNQLVILRADGTVFARAPLPARNGPLTTVPAPNASAVAFTAITLPRTDGLLTHGTETVYLLRPGTHTPVAVHQATVGVGGCGEGGTLEWHGSWLLYSNGPEHLAAIETDGARRTIDLSRLAERLPGTVRGFSAYWSGQPPGT